ncbi:hypothetical protein [Saccharomonospora glauca]|uniref:Flagellar basal body-associated protein FliL n=1 Tax=Saccharomonospora glauca K62 TaxID=928724 RepID=I1CWM3_9PSEU|nr:hypothetical protein [Saccharomonospora glauca]EIE97097.1 hypothetical protein SacglDRAFT_00133 [Saccharomonospora glauca K62]
MSWQEELRKLDEELASGRLSADDYRVRRDQVLSSAVNHGDNPAAAPQEQAQQPQQNQQQGQNADANSTQVIAPLSPPQGTPQQGGQTNLAGAEATQVVSPWQGQQQQPPQQQYPQQPGMASPAGGFPQPGMASPAGGFPQQGPVSPAGGMPQPAQPWNAPEADQSPPWGGSELPPLPSTAHQDGAGQGPETFDTASGGGKKVFVIVAVVVLIAAIGVGSWLLFFNGSDDGGNQPQPSQTSAAPPSPTRPKDDLEIAQLPGTATERTDITTFDDVVANKLLTDDENKAYEEAGAGKARMVVAKLPSGAEAVVLTMETSSTGAAKTAVDELVALQEKNGMDPYDGTLPDGVQGTQIDKTKNYPAAARAHYAHGKTVVRVQVSAPQLSEVGPSFEEIVATQLQALPADD